MLTNAPSFSPLAMALLGRKMENISSWVFDLDDTLYPSSLGINDIFAERIAQYMMRHLGVTYEEANRLQQHYYRKYGVTVRGYMLNHKLDLKDFYGYIQDFSMDFIEQNPHLKEQLQALRGEKYIFTNGSREHAERVTKRLGILDCFSGICAIEDSGYYPKPRLTPYKTLLKKFRLEPGRTIFLDDSLKNLKPAAFLGLTTVLVLGGSYEAPRSEASEKPPFCDFVAPNLRSFLDAAIEAQQQQRSERKSA